MTLPPCWIPPDDVPEPEHQDAPADRSRRNFLIGSAVATAGAIVAPLFAHPADKAPQGTSGADPGPNAVNVVLNVNGTTRSLRLDPRTTLLDALREQLDLTGTKKGCDQGACGACTVLIDGRRTNSCLTLAVMHGGRKIVTVEGLARDGKLNPVQAAFIRNDGFQCGYCTPGQLCSAVALLQEGHAGSEEEIRHWMSGNICRCGAYAGIVAAIREAANASV